MQGDLGLRKESLSFQSTRFLHSFTARFVYIYPSIIFSCPMQCHVSACIDMIGYSCLGVVFQGSSFPFWQREGFQICQLYY